MEMYTSGTDSPRAIYAGDSSTRPTAPLGLSDQEVLSYKLVSRDKSRGSVPTSDTVSWHPCGCNTDPPRGRVCSPWFAPGADHQGFNIHE